MSSLNKDFTRSPIDVLLPVEDPVVDNDDEDLVEPPEEVCVFPLPDPELAGPVEDDVVLLVLDVPDEELDEFVEEVDPEEAVVVVVAPEPDEADGLGVGVGVTTGVGVEIGVGVGQTP